MKPHYLIRFNKEVRTDLAMWLHFLENFNWKSILFPEEWASLDVTRLFTDASGLFWVYFSGSQRHGQILFSQCKLQ
jgi:hypothetical protein